MCGITGFFEKDGRYSTDVFWNMCNQLKHRGPDSGDDWVDPESGIALGHRRLAVIDLSPTGAQPMVSPCDRYILVYNGEIYNALKLSKAMADAEEDIHWRGHSDTEILLAAISPGASTPPLLD